MDKDLLKTNKNVDEQKIMAAFDVEDLEKRFEIKSWFRGADVEGSASVKEQQTMTPTGPTETCTREVSAKVTIHLGQ